MRRPSTWEQDDEPQTIRLQPGKTYMQPSGYKIEMKKHPGAPSWRLVGMNPEGTFCHKPSTVSGGGKSEISKSLNDAVIYRPLFVDDLQKDLDLVQEIFDQDYTRRFKPGFEHEDRDPTRQPLSPERSLGSVIKLLTPTSSYTDEFNDWLASISPRILALAFLIKRFYRAEWGDRLADHLSVDEVDGAPAHELKLDDRNIVASYLRVGFDRMANGVPSSCARTTSRPKRYRWKTISPRPWWCLRAASPAAGRATMPLKVSSWSRIASTACFSARMMPFIPASTSRPRRICRSRTISSPTLNRFDRAKADRAG